MKTSLVALLLVSAVVTPGQSTATPQPQASQPQQTQPSPAQPAQPSQVQPGQTSPSGSSAATTPPAFCTTTMSTLPGARGWPGGAFGSSRRPSSSTTSRSSGAP